MRKICIINQKGGVAKTTTTTNIAYGLAEAGKKVLVIDLDPQGNASTYFNSEEEKKDIYHILIEGADPKDCIHEIEANLHVITARETLTKAELIMAGESSRETIMTRKLAGITSYDYLIMDCAPSLGLLNQNAMLFANEAIVPVSTDYLGVQGLKKIMATINTINDVFAHTLKISKVVPTLYDARVKHCRESLALIQNEFYEAATEPIRMNSKLKEAPQAHKSIFKHARSSNGAKDYRQLVTHILQDDTQTVNPQTNAATQGGMIVTTF